MIKRGALGNGQAESLDPQASLERDGKCLYKTIVLYWIEKLKIEIWICNHFFSINYEI